MHGRTLWNALLDLDLANIASELSERQQRILTSRTQWFVSLAGSLLSTTNETYIQNRDICFEMIGLLLECKSKVAYISILFQEWGKMYDIAEAKMAWYVPGEKGKELVEALLKKFLFPVVESLKDKNMDRESLKKAFTILNFGFSGGVTCFALPSSPPFRSAHSVLPWFKPDSINPSFFTGGTLDSIV
ncbi:hypothetical protein OSTOST_19564 [Ostertagia ostertagi]